MKGHIESMSIISAIDELNAQIAKIILRCTISKIYKKKHEYVE